MANLKSTTIDDTGFLQLPSGTTAERPASPSAGEIRFNTDTKVTEWYDEELDAWFPTGVIPPVATGGDTVEDVDIDGVTYRIHSFTTVEESNFTVTRSGPVDYLIVGGGGAGGGADDDPVAERAGGGGGGGGVIIGNDMVTTGQYTVEVGAGGAWSNGAQNGNPSSFLGQTALGGGHGDDSNGPNNVAGNGSSGGGGARQRDGGSGTPGQGFDGSDSTADGSGAGGGAGGSGQGANQPGGPGIFSGITGTILEYGFGGKGAGDKTGAAIPAIDNRGAGAEGQQTGTGSFQDGVSGGSGIVVVRYKNG